MSNFAQRRLPKITINIFMKICTHVQITFWIQTTNTYLLKSIDSAVNFSLFCFKNSRKFLVSHNWITWSSKWTLWVFFIFFCKEVLETMVKLLANQSTSEKQFFGRNLNFWYGFKSKDLNFNREIFFYNFNFMNTN